MSLRALRTPLTMAILSLLREEPRHPYALQAQLRYRHVGEVVKLRGGSVYDAVRRMHSAGLVAEQETNRAGARPERTVYATTAEGEDLLDELIREYVATPAPEYPVFPAGLAHLANLSHDEAVELLRERAGHVQDEYDHVAELTQPLLEGGMARLVLLETEYAQRLRQAELAWLREVAADIADGTLPWIEKVKQ